MAVAREEFVGKRGGAAGARRTDSRRSGGPRTAAGKARSARNAWKHGLRARKVLVCEEDAGQYAAFRARMFGKWAPRDDDEAFLVHRMTGAMWRLLRCPEVEAELLDTLRDGEAPGGGLARAFLPDGTVDGGAIVRFARYETALERGYFRCLRMLRLMRMAGGARIEADAPKCREGGGAGGVADDWAETAEAAQGIVILSEDDWDDLPVEVEEVILDAEDAEEDWRSGTASGGPARDDEGEDQGEEDPPKRTKADKFPNELDGGEQSGGEEGGGEARSRGQPRRARPGETSPPHDPEVEGAEGEKVVRDWPGEPDYQPVKPKPIQYSEFGARSVFADERER